MNIIPCEFQQEHNSAQPGGKLYKKYVEIGGTKEKTCSSAATITNSSLPHDYKGHQTNLKIVRPINSYQKN